MKKNKICTFAIALTILALAGITTVTPITPVKAADATVDNSVWFVAMSTTAVPGNMSWTNGTSGNIWRNTGFITYFNLLRSPPGTSGSTIIGTMTSQTNLEYNTLTRKGTATITAILNFSETNSTKNPYGVGTMQAKAVNVEVTGMFPPTNPGIGNATGVLIAGNGTGALANKMLTIDFIMVPFPSAGTGPLEAMFFGTHSRVNGMGVLTSLQPLVASGFGDVSLLTGQTWGFFVHSNGGYGATTYQWYEGTTLLTGQTDMVLLASKATAGTYTYTCKVTDALGTTTTSNPITLKVFSR
jgi:hypothetical protein